jgi:hypothetical protein
MLAEARRRTRIRMVKTKQFATMKLPAAEEKPATEIIDCRKISVRPNPRCPPWLNSLMQEINTSDDGATRRY